MTPPSDDVPSEDLTFEELIALIAAAQFVLLVRSDAAVKITEPEQWLRTALVKLNQLFSTIECDLARRRP
jgi:hypothetical protein